MIQFIHVYLNITILYQGDAMQISNLVSQYNNSVSQNIILNTKSLIVHLSAMKILKRLKIDYV